LVKHDTRQAARLRVLLAWVIRGQKSMAGWQARECSMLEARARLWQGITDLLVGAQICVESEPSQRDNRLYVF
jgi:ABC-type uncharacterized transport system permease subunit